jgi:alkylation response protein AidB-like acyl-CoA dehydrogenase
MVDLALSDTQQELQLVARRFLRVHGGEWGGDGEDGFVSGAPWADMAALGWLGLMIPAQFGGGDASPVDAGALYQELGRAPLSLPLFEAAVLAPALILAADGRGEVFASTLASIAAGQVVLSPVVSSATAPPTAVEHIGLELSPRLGWDAVRGRAPWVRHAVGATHFLVLVRAGREDGALMCGLVDASDSSVSLKELSGFAPGQFEVTFDEAPLSGPAVLVGADRMADVARAMLNALPVLCAFQVGSCQAVLDMTIAYSSDRIAFGKPIGTFQRVQDHVIEIVNAFDAARWTTYDALWRAETGEGAGPASHVAKAVTSEAHAAACTHAHEVHAGIGTDLEYGLAVHTRLARTLYAYYGDPCWHRQMLATELGLG